MRRERELLESLSEAEQLFWMELLSLGFDLIFDASGYVSARADIGVVNAAKAGMRPGPDERVITVDPEMGPTAANLRIGTAKHPTWKRGGRSLAGMKGVTRRDGRYKVQINTGDTVIHLGTYASPEEAARVADTWVCENRDKLAYLNFPDEHKECAGGTCTAGVRPVFGRKVFPPRPPCGTTAGHAAHRYRDEKPCEECAEARKRDRWVAIHQASAA